MLRMGDDRSELTELMHRLDVDAEVWGDVPDGADGRKHGAGRERCAPPVVDGDPVRRWEFVSVERGVDTCDDRPRVRVGGRFTGEIACIELCESRIGVVEIE